MCVCVCVCGVCVSMCVCVCVCVCAPRGCWGSSSVYRGRELFIFLFFREIFLCTFFFYLRRVFFMYRVIVGVVVAVDGRHELGALRRRSHVAVHAWGRGVV